MQRKGATVTQADVARVLRAARSAGFTSVRMVVKSDGVVIEASEAERTREEEQPQRDERPEMIL